MDRHVWTDEETEKLAAKMNGRFPGSGFQISHCKNKVKRLKEKYQFAANMAACSGFGWDDVKQCVVVDNKEILAAYMKKQG
ncbi:hypothetical protein HN873_058821, partial [Arachis hypogaea]